MTDSNATEGNFQIESDYWEHAIPMTEENMAKFGWAKVVRCRDCKHFTPQGTHKFENGKTNADFCEYIRGWRLQITPDGFCAWGEKADE